MGITNDGFELQTEAKVQLVDSTDAYGDTVVDTIYRGGNEYLQYDGKEYKAGALTPFWPYGAHGVMGVIGRLGSALAAAVVMTALAGTPAATAPATLTANLAFLAENNPARLLYTSKLREVPTRLRLLPYDAGAGAIKWHVTT